VPQCVLHVEKFDIGCFSIHLTRARTVLGLYLQILYEFSFENREKLNSYFAEFISANYLQGRNNIKRR